MGIRCVNIVGYVVKLTYSTTNSMYFFIKQFLVNILKTKYNRTEGVRVASKIVWSLQSAFELCFSIDFANDLLFFKSFLISNLFSYQYDYFLIFRLIWKLSKKHYLAKLEIRLCVWCFSPQFFQFTTNHNYLLLSYTEALTMGKLCKVRNFQFLKTFLFQHFNLCES